MKTNLAALTRAIDNKQNIFFDFVDDKLMFSRIITPHGYRYVKEQIVIYADSNSSVVGQIIYYFLQ